jgi:uncharacterized membrane protein YeaQ/YmgE (transglycosylase-associated protein family)
MTLIGFLILLVVAAVCGGIGQSIAGYSRGGCLTAIAVGFIGALLGSWLSGQLGLPELLMVEGFPIIWSIVGSALFVAIIALLSRRSSGP